MKEPQETITLTWSMDDESWCHWAQGRGRKTVHAVILKWIQEIQTSQEARRRIKLQCMRPPAVLLAPPEQGGESWKHQVEIQLPAADWGEACQLVGESGGPVSTGELIAALILESASWKQSGVDAAEHRSGWLENGLISSIKSSTELTYTRQLRLGKREKIIAWIVTAAAVAGVAAAWVAWFFPPCG